MREVKFRGRRVDNNEWVYGFALGSQDPTKVETSYRSWFIHSGCRIGLPDRVHDDTVAQFTGLQDRNGDDIYEGMNVRLLMEGEWLEGHQLTEDYWIPFTVVFEEGTFQCVWDDKSEPSMDLSEYWNDGELEIITP
jgi:hypothetical protein